MSGRPTVALLLAVALLPATGAAAEHDLVIFGDAQVVRGSDVEPEPSHVNDEIFGADLLFSLESHALRMFGEYRLTNDESELERLLVGWKASDNLVLSLGRSHQVNSVWTFEHHHGQYLQTSVTRPAIEEWEDMDGIVPQHFVGLLVESRVPLQRGRGLEIKAGWGLAPVITEDGLEPLDLVDIGAYSHMGSAQVRVEFLPDELGESRIGLVLAQNEINWQGPPPEDSAPIDHVDQFSVGVFAKHVRSPWAVLGAAYYIRSDVQYAGSGRDADNLVAGYVQAERTLPHALVGYFRCEGSSGASDSAYVRLFDDFAVSRSVLGIRWDFARKHALTLEVGHASNIQDAYAEYRLQWSAALL